MGAERVVWLPEGIAHDETDGHVDNLACFAAPAHVLLAWTDQADDPNFAICRAAEAALRASPDAKGRAITVSRLPLPPIRPVTVEEAAGLVPVPGSHPRPAGDPVAASYVNFYIANEAVVMPLFGVPEDDAARKVLAAAFPGRRVVGVPAREILLGGGGIHCITQQQPRA